MSKILAVDVGLVATGLAVMQQVDGRWQPIQLACAQTAKAHKKLGLRVADDDANRAASLAREIIFLIRSHGLRRMVVELPHGGGQSARSVRAMALATGMIAAVAEAFDLAVEYYTPGETRAAAGVPKGSHQDDVKAIVLASMTALYPTLAGAGTKVEIEAKADALAAFEAARNGNLVRGT